MKQLLQNRILLLISCLLVATLLNGQEYANKTALIIGNTNYKVGKLRNPVNDAKLLTSTLRDLGFDVISKLDTDKDELKAAVREFQGKISKKKGIALFYYSGHGLQINGNNYLVPVNADIQFEYEVESECVDASRVLRMLEYMDNPLNIVILDACRNNPFARSYRSNDMGLAHPATAPTGSIIAFSTAPNKVASDGVGKNGLYTQELVKAILTPNLSIEEVFKYTRRNVVKLSDEQQIPWENSSLMGDFYFNREQKASEPDNIISPTAASFNTSNKVSETKKPKGSMASRGRYLTTTVNDEEWFQTNLDVNEFSDGSTIPYVSSKEAWENAWKNQQPAWTYADESNNEKVYNWYAVNDSRGLCPKGWKVPSASDWKKLLSKYKGKVFKHYFKSTPAFYYKGKDSKDFLGLDDWLLIGNDALDMKVKPNPAVNIDFSKSFGAFEKLQSAHYWTSDSNDELITWPTNPLIFVKDGGLTNIILPNKFLERTDNSALIFSISQITQIDVQTVMMLEPASKGLGLCVRCVKE